MNPVEFVCVECGKRPAAKARGWRRYLADIDDDGEDEVVFYCPRCGAREFGDHHSGQSRAASARVAVGSAASLPRALASNRQRTVSQL